MRHNKCDMEILAIKNELDANFTILFSWLGYETCNRSSRASLFLNTVDLFVHGEWKRLDSQAGFIKHIRLMSIQSVLEGIYHHGLNYLSRELIPGCYYSLREELLKHIFLTVGLGQIKCMTSCSYLLLV